MFAQSLIELSMIKYVPVRNPAEKKAVIALNHIQKDLFTFLNSYHPVRLSVDKSLSADSFNLS